MCTHEAKHARLAGRAPQAHGGDKHSSSRRSLTPAASLASEGRSTWLRLIPCATDVSLRLRGGGVAAAARRRDASGNGGRDRRGARIHGHGQRAGLKSAMADGQWVGRLSQRSPPWGPVLALPSRSGRRRSQDPPGTSHCSALLRGLRGQTPP
jgi:hypothetical protein